MNKFIGGLVVLSLLGSPQLLRTDYVAYEIFRTNRNLIDYLKKEDEYEETAGKESEVEKLMGDISYNKRNIFRLFREKDHVVEEIDGLMKQKAKSKETLSDEFMFEFKKFSDLYDKERGDVNRYIEEMEKVNLNEIAQEILHNSTDYGNIVTKFDRLIHYQRKIITFLERVIYSGKQILGAV